MRTLWIAGSLVAGACNVPVESFHHNDAQIDIPGPDAADTVDALVPVRPAVTSFDQPVRIATGDTVAEHISVHAQTAGPVTWTIAPTNGSVAPTSGSVDLDANGNGTFMVSYTAAATAGDDALTVHLDDGVAQSQGSYTAKVRALVSLGEATPFADSGGLTVAANLLYGEKITVATQAYAMRMGTFVDNGGFSGRLALYLDHGANPATLVAETALQAITIGRDELRLGTPVQLNPGTYWIMGNFDAGAQVRRDGNDKGLIYLPLASNAAMPTTTAGSTAVTGKTLNFFLDVIP